MNTTVAGSALEVLLTDATTRGDQRFLRPRAAAGVAAGLARRPDRPVRRAGALGAELVRAVAGRSELRPPKGDRRFADAAWDGNPVLRRLLQGYLAVGEGVDGLISDAELDWRSERQARFAAGNLLDALAPTNFPWSNPTVMKATVDQRGANLARGARQALRDLSHSPRLPESVDPSGFSVGENLATTPGAVVLRTEVFELIQYRPQTDEVREVPVLVVPPTINKFYVFDLAPGRSMVEYLVQQGQQVFVMSWRNPDQEHGSFDLDTYAEAVLEARDATAAISGHDSVHLTAACSGGIIGAGALGHLAAEGRLGEVESLTLLVCALDNARAGTAGALATREAAAAAVAESARKGYLDGQALAGVFAWLRPNDLIWSYVVNNYLLGRRPPAFDVLFWNQDTVRLAAGLHRDFIRIGLANSLTRPGEAQVLDSPVDLGAVDIPGYVVGGRKDHIVPWENTYRSASLLGGESRFVLSTSGHIQALVNPPAPDSRSSYLAADGPPAGTNDFLEGAETHSGSWWPDWAEWLSKRSGDLRPAPTKLGGSEHRALGKAPGSYVHAR
jgi:poly[(R)-3-hydroxyalkanoate] polymerase subunit PhaC